MLRPGQPGAASGHGHLEGGQGSRTVHELRGPLSPGGGPALPSAADGGPGRSSRRRRLPSGGGSVGRKSASSGEPVNSSKWKSTFSPISDLSLAKAVDSPLQAAGSALSHSPLFSFRPALEEPAAEAKLPSHPRKAFAGSLAAPEGPSPGANPPNGLAFSGGLAGDLGLHSFNDGAPLSHKGPEVAGLSAPLSFPSQRAKDSAAAEANPFLSRRQPEGLSSLKGEGSAAKESAEALPLGGPADKVALPHGARAGKGRDRELDFKGGHNLFISAAAVPPGGLLGGPGLVTVASSAASATPAAQAPRPFLSTFPAGPQFTLGPVSLQANLGSVAGSSVLQSLFSTVPAAAAGLVHVSSTATRLTNSHTMGSFSSGVAGGTVGGRQGRAGRRGRRPGPTSSAPRQPLWRFLPGPPEGARGVWPCVHAGGVTV